MNNKIGKVIWFTFKQVITSNWYSLITVMGIVCVFLSTQADAIIGFLFGSNARYSSAMLMGSLGNFFKSLLQVLQRLSLNLTEKGTRHGPQKSRYFSVPSQE